ncbi:hypothetical protein XELAEV_18034387mg [Xenopus laevis]|uniref:G-protein coupled receptors family 1 profile domain-containing protein n=1 Tax=Xenopus laevis TaxID=8355 RepID=A0A974CDW7_XENLA|nr:hypothetical protein XELAEV_18034387mg [Xenopus laevis]
MSSPYHGNASGFIIQGFSDDPELQLLLFLVFLSIYLVILLGNLILVISLNSHLHTPMYLLLLTLSFNDISSSTNILPTLLHILFTQQKNISFLGCMTQVYVYMSLLVVDDIFMVQLLTYIEGALVIFCFFLPLLISYLFIILAILKIQSSEGRKKAFYTCASHLICVLLFYGTLVSLYVRPTTSFNSNRDRFFALLHIMLIPLLNPLIYTLKNKEFKSAFIKLSDCRSQKDMFLSRFDFRIHTFFGSKNGT